jgi:NADPH:quinone reductase-like Zn-dependent oxidoreductase
MAQPVPRHGEVLIKVQAAAINPSDVKNVMGKMSQTTFPRTPGRDFAGVIEQGPADLIGRSVFGTGGDLGYLRDGSHAEYLIVPVEAVVPRPDRLSAEQATAMGLAYMTAWAALVDAAQLEAGENILITGVTGAVGSAAARIARLKGAKVFGTIRQRTEQSAIPHLPIDHFVNMAEGPLHELVATATAGHGADVVLDVVGGPLFEPCLKSLAHRGRQVAMASTGDLKVSFDLVDFYHREGSLFGVDTLKLGFAESASVLRGLLKGIESGEFKPPELETVTLDGAVSAYQAINFRHPSYVLCVLLTNARRSHRPKPAFRKVILDGDRRSDGRYLEISASSCAEGVTWTGGGHRPMVLDRLLRQRLVPMCPGVILDRTSSSAVLRTRGAGTSAHQQARPRRR